MRCGNCGQQNKKNSNYCTRCGGRLDVDKKVKSGLGKAPKGFKLRAALLAAAGLVLLFALAAVLMLYIKKGSPAPAEALITPRPTMSPKPLDMMKPTPSPTPTPTPTPTPRPTMSPKPLDMIKPTPAPTPEPTEQTEPANTVLAYDGDCEPIDALCSFILEGEAQYARRAFPPEYISGTVANYGFAMQLLGSEDAVIEYAGGLLLAGFTSKYGTVTAIDYTVTGRHVLNEAELEELTSHLGEYYVTGTPQEAHLIDADLVITSSRGVFTESVSPHVILLDGVWYIDPADIDL